MLRTAPTMDEQDLERAMLRKSVDTLAGETQPLRRLRAHPADRREPVPLRVRGDGLRALQAAARRRAGELERMRTSASGNTVRIHRLNPS